MAAIALGVPPGPVRMLSRLILGTDHLGKVPEAQTIAVRDEAVRLGSTAFDTAPIYANDIERRLGRWLQARQRPDLAVIT
jgi:aryl-alcohol dehydrogenase-like predicted oxidoreductase